MANGDKRQTVECIYSMIGSLKHSINSTVHNFGKLKKQIFRINISKVSGFCNILVSQMKNVIIFCKNSACTNSECYFLFKSIPPQWFFRISVLDKCSKLYKNHTRWSTFLNIIAGCFRLLFFQNLHVFCLER